jgi:hypothetical protein
MTEQHEQPSIIPVVSVSGERGPTGDPGQDGRDGRVGDPGQRGRTGVSGETGGRGVQGIQGKAALPFSRAQALVLFGIVVLGIVVLVWLSSNQTERLEAQQQEIRSNTEQIRDANYAGCLSGLVFVKQFNAQQDALAAIEQTLIDDPNVSDLGHRLGVARVKAYNAGKIPLDPTYRCVR